VTTLFFHENIKKIFGRVFQKPLRISYRIPIFIAVILLWYGASLACYHAYFSSVGNSSEYANYSEELNKKFAINLQNISSLMTFIGENIARNYYVGGEYDLDGIADIVQSKFLTDEVFKEENSLEMFEWGNTQRQIIVSTAYGILKDPLSTAHKRYSKDGLVRPWVMHFENPAYGLSSRKWLVPVGIGVTEKSGNVIGILTTGIGIERLHRHLLSVLPTDKNIAFAIIDADNHLVVSYGYGEKVGDKKTAIVQMLSDQEVERVLANPITVGDAEFLHVKRVKGFPNFTIFTGYNTRLAAIERLDFLFKSTVLLVVVFWLLIGWIKTFNKSHLIIFERIFARKNIRRLSRHLLLPGSKEFVFRVMKLRRDSSRDAIAAQADFDQATKKIVALDSLVVELEEKNEILVSRNHVLESINERTKAPMNAINTCAETLLLARSAEEKDQWALVIKSHLDQEGSAAVFKYNEIAPVNIKDVVHSALLISLEKAEYEGVKIIKDVIEASMPAINGDELQLKVMISSMFAHSIEFTPSGGLVRISAVVERHVDDTPAFLKITVQDNGYGLAEEERNAKLADIEKSKNILPTRGTPLHRDLKTLKYFAEQGEGFFTVVAEFGVGTIFTLRLPYSRKAKGKYRADVKRKPASPPGNKPGGKAGNKSGNKSGNIINFPK
jgi:signal transduction histidine kinase